MRVPHEGICNPPLRALRIKVHPVRAGKNEFRRGVPFVLGRKNPPTVGRLTQVTCRSLLRLFSIILSGLGQPGVWPGVNLKFEPEPV